MAIYEYYCAKCRHVFSLQRLMTEFDKSASCPTCETVSSRVLSGFATKIDLNIQLPGKEPFRIFDQ